jgi:hypothetical protein
MPESAREAIERTLELGFWSRKMMLIGEILRRAIHRRFSASGFATGLRSL